jgi:3-isopropylmalate/(R)-2-methylmalate dehydratase large subunit
LPRAKMLFSKVWEQHLVVPETVDTPAVLYIDIHLLHEVTSPQAFSVLSELIKVRRPERTLATLDHATPTLTQQLLGGSRAALGSAAMQIAQLQDNRGIVALCTLSVRN